MAALPSTPAYVRVDLLYDAGHPRIVEVELVEPYLWFALAPGATGPLSDALAQSRASRGRRAVAPAPALGPPDRCPPGVLGPGHGARWYPATHVAAVRTTLPRAARPAPRRRGRVA